jgi:tRNA pseudouridine13 synthase
MKLKQHPDDFRVEELSAVVGGSSGAFALYRLDKTGWTTPDAVGEVCRRWKLDRRDVSHGGLKDRHAVTSQHVTIRNGPSRNLSHDRISLTFLGRTDAPFTSSDITANRFAVTLRGLSDTALSLALAALAEVERVGVPNYFDDQRFGSVGDPPAQPVPGPRNGRGLGDEGGEFIGKEMVFGRFERALWLALAAPYEFDRAGVKREKGILRDNWGKWPECRNKLPHGDARRTVDYLAARPTDFRGAIGRLRPELQGLYLAAYQSFVWNKMLAAWLARRFAPTDLGAVELKLGRVPVPLRVDDATRPAWESLSLPLPSARLKLAPDAEWSVIAEDVLKGEGLTLAEMRVKGMHKPFFSKGDRIGCVRPAGLSHEVGADELNAGGKKLALRFELPRGSYATMVVKRIIA